MTTIAYRNGVMAADSGAWLGDMAYNGVRKMAKGKSGWLYGCAGNASEIRDFLVWVDKGEAGDMPKPEAVDRVEAESAFIVLAAKRGKPLRLYSAFGYEEMEMPYMSIGSGKEVAMGALYAGATAHQAIEAAIVHGSGALPPVVTISWDE